eukprot:10940562-Karenia_brevis.AAC.1
MLRHDLRMKEWKAAASRRSDMSGIENGINKEATQVVLNSSKFQPYEKSQMRAILAGGLWTQDRKSRARM